MRTKRLLLSLVFMLVTATLWADVAINETNFPDENFRNWLKSQSYGSDGVLTDAEIAGVTSIEVSKKSIKSLQGIEFFTALEQLECDYNQITSLDVSKNTMLKILECSSNKLTSLDVSKNKALAWLICYRAKLTALDLSKNTALIGMACGGNQLTTLDVSANTALTSLNCSSNQLTSLDVSKNTALTWIDCSSNQIKRPAMDALIASLPSVSSGTMRVIYDDNEGNVINTTQLAAARAKGWKPCYYESYQWLEYAVSEPVIEGIAINETNFPDANFRNWVLSQSYGSDGVLTDAEIAGVTRIYVSYKSIKSLQGIEFFTALTDLSCGINQLTALDLSKNTALTELYCGNNSLTALDVSKNTALRYLDCGYNSLTALDVSKNTLRWLLCGNNSLTALDVSKNTALTRLECYSNQLTALDVSKNTALTDLSCGYNQLTSLDVSKNTALERLSCDGNLLTTLDVSKNTALEGLFCYNNQLTSLDVSKNNTALTYLFCYGNQIKGAAMDALVASLPTISSGTMDVIFNKNEGNVITTTQVAAAKAKGWTPQYYDGSSWLEYAVSEPVIEGIAINETNFPDETFRNYLLTLDGGKDGILKDYEIADVTRIYVENRGIKSLQGIEFFTALTRLECNRNQLTALDVSKNTALTKLYCNSNQLTALDVSKNTALTRLECACNQLTSLNVSGCTALEWLYCGGNQLTTLDVSGCTALTYLACGEDHITALDVSGCTALTWMDCYENQLTALDVSKNTALFHIECGNNQLTALDVSKNTALGHLVCYGNQLTTLDVSKNTALTDLSCGKNQLTALDVSKNTTLEYLGCDGNQLTTLDVSKNTALRTLDCYGNQLTALDVSKNTTLEYLGCDGNQLTTLDVSKNTALTTLQCYSNQIKGAAMDALVASLPTISSGTMDVIYNENEGNVITTTQVAAAKAKGWTPRYYDGSRWQEYAGSEPVVLKCATPIFAYFGGKMILRCATEGVKYACSLGFETNENLKLPSKVKISIYATKDGYEPSDTLTQVIDPRLLLGKVGDVNGDGEVGMPDVMYIVNHILNGKFPDE